MSRMYRWGIRIKDLGERRGLIILLRLGYRLIEAGLRRRLGGKI